MKLLITFPFSLLLSASTIAAEPVLNFSGDVGYINLPSTNMPSEGETSFTYFDGDDLSGQRLQFQAFPWLSTGVVFSNSLEGGVENGIDLKLRLWDETAYTPSIALGFQDFLGNGPRSAEYIAATKNFGAFEGSLGLGWGALSGTNALIENDDRPASNKHDFSTDHMFKGDASPFIGLSYSTPIHGLSVSAEYLERENDDNFAYGLQYRPNARFGIGAYMLGEERFGFAITLAGNPYQPVTPQDLGAPPVAVIPRHLIGIDRDPSWAQIPNVSQAMGEALAPVLLEEGAKLVSAKFQAQKLSLEVQPTQTLLTPKTIGRLSRLLAMNAPGSIEEFEIIIINGLGIPVSSSTINRSQFEALQDHPERNQGAWEMVQINGAKAPKGADVYHAPIEKRLDWNFGISTDFNLFGDDAELQLIPYINASYQLTRGLSLNAQASLELYDIDTVLPDTTAKERIRSDKDLYRQDTVALDRLAADYHFKIGRDLYGRASVGLLERQFGGIDGELIYAPPQSKLAFGLQAASLIKRDPESFAGFLEDAEYSTGFATLYLDTGFKGLEASLGYGQFIGEDWGSMAKISRKFRNGWRVEGGITIPDAFYDSEDTRELAPSLAVTIPLQWSMPTQTKSTTAIRFSRSTSDQGAILNSANPLYPTIRDYDATDYELRWGAFWQ